ncbi:MAG: hypothetical protein CMP26_03165 [Roseibacillus sp.]|nr:hypothetical protein [Roseibacillus sp.]
MQANTLLPPEEILFAGIERAPLVKLTDVSSPLARRLFQRLPIPSIVETAMTVFKWRARTRLVAGARKPNRVGPYRAIALC